MSLLRFYPGGRDPREKKRKQIENDDEKQKKKQKYEKNRPDWKFSSKWQTERPWLVYNEGKHVMTCTTCIEFFQSDKISNPFHRLSCLIYHFSVVDFPIALKATIVFMWVLDCS
jgi:hypothetical protein